VVLALIHVSPHAGYLVLALLVGVESMGVPVPGETALITAGVLAERGQLDITLVIVIAAGAAIVGDNIGYLIGRKGGRRLLLAPGPLEQHRRKVLEYGEPFFRRHGAKAVFLGRWFAGLRIAAAWLAGMNHMDWRRFLFWNALGGIAWATSVGLASYLLGSTAEKLIKDVGVFGVVALALAVAAFVLWRRRQSRPA
jgi:membrane protein DedA with SNARE-associated domain